MPHPSKSTDAPDRRRVRADALPPPERTSAQMLALLRKVVNRKVESLRLLTNDGALDLDEVYDDTLANLIELVCKLAREERASEGPFDPTKLTNEQLLAAKKPLDVPESPSE